MTVISKHTLATLLVRPVLIKLGGSVVTDKSADAKVRKPALKRLLGEIKRAGVPAVILHGAGSFGHPPAAKHQIGRKTARANGVAETLAAVGLLHAEVIAAAQAADLKPISFPLHHNVTSEGGELEGLPVNRLQRAIEEGFTPILSGTLVRDDQWGWRVASADEFMADLAPELNPRLAVFCTDVDGVYGQSGVLATVGPADVNALLDMPGSGADVTGRMGGKLGRAFQVAACCPTWIVNGMVRNRLLDVLKGKAVEGTRIAID